MTTAPQPNRSETPTVGGFSREARSGSSCYAGATTAWFSVTIFWLCLVVATLDRQVISITAGAIQADLHLTDTQLGLLQGPAFAFCAALTGIPLGWLLDRLNRVSVASICFALWSLATTLGGFAGSFGSLALARGGGAVGEAGLAPAALSIFADRFPPNRVPRASSLFLTAPFVGGGLGLFVGGLLLDAFTRNLSGLPAILQGFHPWQLVFIAVGCPGVVLAVLLKLVVKDAVRLAEPPIVSQVLEHKRSRGRGGFLVIYVLGMTALVVIMYVQLAWLPLRLLRSFNMTAAQAGIVVGPSYILAGLIGAGVSSWLSSTVPEEKVIRRVVEITLMASVLLIAPFLAAALSSVRLIAGWGFFVGSVLLCTALTLASAPIQLLVSGRFRARALAMTTVSFNVLGAGLGPLIAGSLSDHLPGSDNAIGRAMAIVTTASALLAAATFVSLRGVLRPVEMEIEGGPVASEIHAAEV